MQTFTTLIRDAEEEVAVTIGKLPASLRKCAGTIPVCFERRPSPVMIKDGVDGDVMGLFVGNSFAEQATGDGALPGQIILFLETIMEEAGGDRGRFRQEIRTTFLHELGHYLGLDELELVMRGIE